MLKLKMILLLVAFFSSIIVYPAHSTPIVTSSIVSSAVDPPLPICTIPGPDFALSASPGTVAITKPSSLATSTITVSSLHGFSGTLSITNSTSATGLNITLSKTSVTISKTTPGTTILKITNSTVVAAGSYVVTVTAANATVSNTVDVTVIVPTPGYSLSPAPFFITIVAGSMNFSTVTVTSLNGFAGKVNLTASTPTTLGLSAVPNKSSVTLTSPGTALFNVTVSTTTLTPHGFYPVTVTGTSGSLSNSTIVEADVIGPDFTVSPKPLTLTLGQTDIGTSTINVTRVMSFTGTVGLTTTVIGGLTPFPPTASFASSTVTLSSTMPSATDVLTITTSTTPYNVYGVEVNATSGTIKNYAFVIVTVSGLNISPSKSALTLNAGGASNTTTITLQSVHGFSGNVTLSGSCFPYGELTASISPSSAVLSSGSMSTSTLTVSAAADSAPGTYTVDISGTNTTAFPTFSIVTNTTLVTVTVYGPDFKLTTATSTVSFTAGSPTTSTITVTSLLGFTGDVSFSSFIIPSTGLTVTCTTVTGAMGVSTCTYTSSTVGTYAVLVTGTSGAITHSLSIAVFVSASSSTPDFSLTASSASAVSTGVSATSIISLSGQNGFSGTVVFSVSAPSGVSCSISPTSITLPSSTTTTLSCSSPTAGTYPVTVTATSGSVSHTQTVNITVNSSPSSSSSQPYLLYGIIGAVIAATLAGVTLYARSRQKPPSKPDQPKLT